MRLQTLILPNNNEYPDMYYRGNLCFSKCETISFDTYYNSFSYTKYRDYTNAEDVVFKADFSGRATVRLCVYDGEEHIICEREAENSVEITIPFEELPQNGFLYPKFIALTDCEIYNGGYYSDCKSSEINVCIGICTFKREDYVKRNLELLREYDFSFLKKVFVSDNGNTLDCQNLSDDFITVLYNKNYGGSGGFTRCLIEAYDNKFSHIILMDDDIELIPEKIEQMTVFMSILSDKYASAWFSAGMIPLDKPWEQFELGAEWNGKCAVVHKHKLDMRKKENLLDNLDNPGVGYGGWWTLCMPVSVVENGLPYPFFIKFDDVEYGLRKSADTEIITMNGIAVRHEAFDKKISFVLDYYNLRNELIVNTIYDNYGVGGVIKRFWYEVCKELLLYRYDNIPLVTRAVRDYLKGAVFFTDRDDEKLNTELIRSVPKLIPLEDISEWNESLRCDEHVKNKSISTAMALTAGGHLVPSLFLKKDIFAYPLSRVSAKDTFMKNAVIQYQLGGNAGIMTKRSFGKFIKYGFASTFVVLQILFRYSKCRKSLKTQKENITSMDFWKKRLGID